MRRQSMACCQMDLTSINVISSRIWNTSTPWLMRQTVRCTRPWTILDYVQIDNPSRWWSSAAAVKLIAAVVRPWRSLGEKGPGAVPTTEVTAQNCCSWSSLSMIVASSFNIETTSNFEDTNGGNPHWRVEIWQPCLWIWTPLVWLKLLHHVHPTTSFIHRLELCHPIPRQIDLKVASCTLGGVHLSQNEPSTRNINDGSEARQCAHSNHKGNLLRHQGVDTQAHLLGAHMLGQQQVVPASRTTSLRYRQSRT